MESAESGDGSMADGPAPARLDRLELENFKSYGGKVVVGPFKGFNAVIGTNGSGKSNLMDAISFVLGVRTAQLRGNQLRDLVYRNLSDPDDNPKNRKAAVKLFYRKENDGGTVEFSRTVSLSGTSEYRVNGRVMSLDRYNKELAKIGIHVKARNFLVFQNEVESIASKSPSELTALFEEVSGSAEFRDEYNEACTEKDTAEEQVTEHWAKRKGMAAEKRQYKQQKDEADKYQRLRDEVANTKTMQAMYQLYHLDKEIQTCVDEASDADKDLAEKKESLNDKYKTLVKTKDLVATLDKKRLTQEKKVKRLQDEIDKFRPAEVKYKTELSSTRRRLKGDERSLDKAKENATDRSKVVDTLQSDLQKVESEVADMKKQIDEAEQANISDAIMAEYRSLKETAATRTAALNQAAGVAEQSRSSAARQKDATDARHSELRRRHAAATNDFTTFRQRAEDLAKQRQTAKAELDSAMNERQRLGEVGGERDRVRAELEKTVNHTTQSLRDAKADMHESSRERAFNAAYESMQRLFPGVKGRLSDLCKPTQPRYREAIAVVFGKLMNAIVVDNGRTGSDCIAYMKDQRVGMATFIPLETIRPRPPDEALRRLGGTARLVLDVVDHHESITKAVLYASANAVVCDTLDEARRLRYEDGHKIKICSLDGTLINKSGFMTGGVSRSSRDRAAQWDRSEIEVLKRKRAKAQEELQAMGAPASDRRTVAALAEQIDSLQRKVSILDNDRADCESRSKNADVEAKNCEKEINLLDNQVRSAEDAFRRANTEFKKIETELHGLENELFGDFAERHGIATVQDFEKQFVKRNDALKDKLLELEAKQSRLTSSLKYERTSGGGGVVSKLEDKIKAHEELIARVESSLENLGSKRSELTSRAESGHELITKLSGEREEKYAELREMRQEYRRGKDALTELEANLSHQQSSVDHLRSKRATILSDAKLAQVHIPFSDADGNAAADPMDIDTGQTEEATQEGEDAANVVVDYSDFPENLQGSANSKPEVRSRKLSEMAENVKKISAQLDSMAPNMRAKEHMDEVQGRLTEMEREAEKARNRVDEASAKYNDVIEKRKTAFRDCFDHIAGKINEVYKHLTMSANYPMGGTAYLSLEQESEPYLGGIKYNAMPPTKRFRDMDQLSGGERTVAALALLFAIHDYRPSPFFVLDEIDAALDNLNVGKVSNYIRSRAPDLQTIVISLKDAFFEKADALVGIYRDVNLNSSRLLTMDLSIYPDEHQVSEQAA